MSCIITGHLVTAVRGTEEFRSGDHSLLMGEGREEIQRRHVEAADTALGEAQAATSKPDARRLGRIQQTGVWIFVLPSTVNWTELGAQEWRYSLFLIYGIDPPDLLYHCNGCGSALLICHALE